ncbi:MAG TPA: 50S ribosomal protein L17 [Anaerolineae bacterium]|nr:50S ribosomal protein L17 [Anaerolineae bacterium]HIQ12423.1 50S ribosomal protein L17 [Caldilineales bacterium]
MRHKKKTIHFGRDVDHRKALFKNLVTELVRHGQIETTEAKAKALRPRAERLITIAKRGRSGRISEVHAKRLIRARLNDPDLVSVVYDELASRYESRPGGYTRIMKTGFRQGDAARMAIIEFVE